MLELLSGFVAELRAAGLPVSLTEHLDAARAVHHVPMEDRPALKAALGATLVKSGSHWPAFETAFEIYFSPRVAASAALKEDGEQPADPPTPGATSDVEPSDAGGPLAGGGGSEPMSAAELAALLFRAMRQGDRALGAALARHA